MHMVLEGAAAFARPALRFLETLPPGMRLEHDRLHVDLAVLLAHNGAADVLPHLAALELTTTEGRAILSGRLQADQSRSG